MDPGVGDGVSEAEVQRRCEQAAAEASAEGEESLNDLLVCLGQVARHTSVLCSASQLGSLVFVIMVHCSVGAGQSVHMHKLATGQRLNSASCL